MDLLRKPDEVLARQHLAASAADAGRQAAQTRHRDRVPALRGVRQPRRHRAHRLAHARHASAGCSNGIRRRPSSAIAQPDARRIRGLGCVDVDRPGGVHRHRRSCSRGARPRRCRSRRRSFSCGSRRRRSPGGSAGRWRGARRASRASSGGSCGSSRAGPGRISRNFVGPEDHFLPPDNFQEHPTATVAHRTSPTNMGFALLANLAAYDFGYIPAGQLIRRTGDALGTMAGDAAPRGPLLQLVRHAIARSPCIRSMSRRWTAATSPATC